MGLEDITYESTETGRLKTYLSEHPRAKSTLKYGVITLASLAILGATALYAIKKEIDKEGLFTTTGIETHKTLYKNDNEDNSNY